MQSKLSLTEEQYNNFHQTGFLIIPSFYEIDNEIHEIKKSVYAIIGLVAKKYDIKLDRQSFTPEFFDDGYLELIASNRSYGGEVYDAVKQIPAFLEDVFK